MAACYLSLGSNLGNRWVNLQSAAARLAPVLQVMRCSSVYQTAPWGFPDQPDFLNQVIFTETARPPLEVLRHLKAVESALGRQPTFRYGPRLVDLDLLAYEDWVFSSPELTLPHARLHERAFVLVPFAEIAPDWRHPVLQRSIRQLLELVDASDVKLYPEGRELHPA